METKYFIARLHKVSSPDGNYLVVYRVNGHFRAFNYLMEVLHIFDRQDLFHLYDLVMKQYSEITPEDIELILWGDLKIMMESSTEENDQELKDGTVIFMLVERKYHLSKELLQQMLDLGLEVEEESTPALQLEVVLAIGFGQWVQMCLMEGRMGQVAMFEMRVGYGDKRVVLAAFELWVTEKVKALGAKGVVKGSRLRVVWMMLCGGIERVIGQECVFHGIMLSLLGWPQFQLTLVEGESDEPESDELEGRGKHMGGWKVDMLVESSEEA
ncbi:hypothetical protein Tco_0027128 [Tanacetum coccineum]